MAEQAKPDLSEVAESLGGSPVATVAEVDPGEAKRQADLKAFEEVRVKYTADKKGEVPKERTGKEKRAAIKEEQADAEVAAKVISEKTKAGQEASEAAKAEESAKPKEQPEDTDESRKAREFLRLKQSAPPGVIDSLSPAEAIEWHTQVARREAEIDRTYREAAELRKQLDDKPDATEAEPTVPAVEVDIEPLKTRLANALGEEESEGIAAELRSAITRGVEPYKDLLSKTEERLASLEKTLEDARRSNTEVISRNNRQRLGEVLPVLAKSDKAWSAVEREVIDLVGKDPSRHSGAEGYFDEAVKELYGSEALEQPTVAEKESEEEEAALLQEEKDRVEASTPTVKTKKSSSKKLSPDDQQRVIFSYLQKHPGDVHGAQRAAGVS